MDEMMDKLRQNRNRFTFVDALIEKMNDDRKLKGEIFTNIAAQNRYNYLMNIIKEEKKGSSASVFLSNKKNGHKMIMDQWSYDLNFQDDLSQKEKQALEIKYGDGVEKFKEMRDDLKKVVNAFKRANEKQAAIDLKEEKGEDISNLEALMEEDWNDYIKRASKFGKNLIAVARDAGLIMTVDEVIDLIKIGENAEDYSFADINRIMLNLEKVYRQLAKGNNVFERNNQISVQNIARTLTKVRKDIYEDTFTDVLNRMRYSYSTPSYMSKFISNLKKTTFESAEEVNRLRKDPFYANSPWLSELIDSNGEVNMKLLEEFEFALIDGRKVDNSGKAFANMNRQDLWSFKLNSFFNSFDKKSKSGSEFGWYQTPILGDATQSMFVKFKKYSRYKAVQQIAKAIAQEAARIREYNDSLNEDGVSDKFPEINGHRFDKFVSFDFLYDFNKDGVLLSEVPEDATDEQKTSLAEIINKKGTDGEYLYFFSSQLPKIIEPTLDRIIELEIQEMAKDNIIQIEETLDETNQPVYDEETGDVMREIKAANKMLDYRIEDVEGFLEEYVLNDILAQSQLSTLLNGDLAYYKDNASFWKRAKQIHSPGTFLDVDAMRSENYNMIVLDDISLDANMDVVLELIDGADLTSKEKARIKGLLQDKQGKYTSDETDGQTFIDIVRLKDIMEGLQRWEDKHQRAYDRIIKGEETGEDIALFMPLKPFYYAKIADKKTGKIIPTQVKTSEFMITPRMALDKDGNIINKNYAAVLESMGYDFEKMDYSRDSETGKIINRKADVVTFSSALKVGNHGVTTFDQENSIIPEDAYVHTLRNEDYRLQQETPEHYFETEALFASQLRKLIMGNLSGDNKNMIKEFNEIISTNVIEDFKNTSKRMSSHEDVINMLREEVVNMGLGEQYLEALEWMDKSRTETMVPLYMPIHVERIERLLTAVYRKNTLKQHVKGGQFVNVSSFGISEKLKIVKNEYGGIDHIQVMLPKWMSYQLNKSIEELNDEDPRFLEGLLYRIPNEELYSDYKIKVVGWVEDSAGVIMPPEVTKLSGLDFDIDKMFAWFYETEIVNGKTKIAEYSENPNKFNYLKNTPEAREIYKKYQKEINENWEASKRSKKWFTSRINNILKDESIAENEENKKQIFEAVDVYRYNLAYHEQQLEIQDELSEEEIDYHKKEIRYIIDSLKEFNKEMKEAKIISKDIGLTGLRERKKEKTEEFKKKGADLIEKRNKEINDLMSDEEFNKLPTPMKNSRKARNNKLLSMMLEILSMKESIPAMFTPGNFKLLKDRARQKGSELSLNPVRPSSSVEMAMRNQAGRDLIGMFANHNAIHAYTQYSDISFPAITIDGIEYNTLGIQRELKFDDEGNIVEGKRVSENLAMFLAAVVDNAKEPVAAFLNINTFTADVLSFLLRSGVPVEKALDFVDNEGIREIAEEYYRFGANKEAENMIKRKLPKVKGGDLKSFSENGLSFDIKDLTPSQAKVFFMAIKTNHSAELVALNRALKSDNPSKLSTLADYKAYIENNKRVRGDRMMLQNIPEFIDNSDITQIKAFSESIDKTYEEVLDIIEAPWESDFFERTRNIIQNKIINTELSFDLISSKTIAMINRTLLNQLAADFEPFDFDLDMIKGMPDRIKSARKNEEFKELGIDDLLYKFVPIPKDQSRNNAGFPILGLTGSNGQSEYYIDKIREIWGDLLTSHNEDARELAVDLVKYAFFQNGFSFGPNSFAHMIPVEAFTAIKDSNGVSLRDHIKEKVKMVNKGGLVENASASASLFIRNFFRKISEIPIEKEENILFEDYKGDTEYVKVKRKDGEIELWYAQEANPVREGSDALKYSNYTKSKTAGIRNNFIELNEEAVVESAFEQNNKTEIPEKKKRKKAEEGQEGESDNVPQCN